jgi:hypothetical protein
MNVSIPEPYPASGSIGVDLITFLNAVFEGRKRVVDAAGLHQHHALGLFHVPRPVLTG